MRLCQALQGRRTHCRPRRSARVVDGLCPRRGARELDLADRQADHADVCRTRRVVRRRGDVRRRAAHARCLCPRRHHGAVRGTGRLPAHTGPAQRAVRSIDPPAGQAHPPALRAGRGPQHPAPARTAGQAASASGPQLRPAQPGRRQRDPHRPATGAGRASAIAGRLAPARQPGAQVARARSHHPHRTRRLGHPQPAGPCWASSVRMPAERRRESGS